MNDDGDTKDDVRMPDGEIGDKITKLFKTDEKDTSMSTPLQDLRALPRDIAVGAIPRALELPFQSSLIPSASPQCPS